MCQREFITKLKETYKKVGYTLVIDCKSSDKVRVGYFHYAKGRLMEPEEKPLYFKGVSTTGAIYLTDIYYNVIQRIN